MTPDRLAELLAGFRAARLAVIGDFFVDRYLLIDPALAERSLETGLEAHQVTAVRPQPGAAGTVTSNLAALDVGLVQAVGYSGVDGEGFELRRGLAAAAVGTTWLLEAPERMTPTYTKPLQIVAGQPPRELNRLDLKNRTATPPDLEARLLAALEAAAAEVDAIIVADQVAEPDCGVITAVVRQRLAELGRARPELPIWVDSRAHVGAFRDVIVKPNRDEAAAIVRAEGQAPEALQLHQLGRELARRNRRPAVVTLGAEGALVADERDVTLVPGVPVSGPIDIVGAGDSFTAGAVSTLAAGGSLIEAAQVGCLVASITIQQLGTTGTASPEQVAARLAESPYRE